jgi:hypothetical protein
VTDNRHSDNFRRVDAAAAKSAAKDKPAPAKQVDNDAQAALAEAERERSFAVGGDAPESGPPTPRPTPMLDSALVRLRASDRPSPFGVAHFPPLPMPPGMK